MRTAARHPVVGTDKATARLSLRISPAVKKMFRTAAKLCNYTLTGFVIHASQDAAEKVLADQTRFVLPEKQWIAFNAALDAPPKDIPALKTLFSKPSVFDEQPCSPRRR